MVQLVNNGKSEPSSDQNMTELKLEFEEEEEDTLQQEHAPLHKRYKRQSLGGVDSAAEASEYNPLDEPSPLGLRLRKSPSLLELIQMKLSESSSSKSGARAQRRKEPKASTSAASGDKLKASNFPASVLKIGTWEYKSRYEGDLVGKCYFAKHKLVWEVLDGGLKNKIEVQWSDIMALKATYPDDSHGTLDVVLARKPMFFRETNPQPRKHTIWQATSDFTGGQASIHRRHYLECPQGLLGKHFEKLIQCDPRLHFLSRQGQMTLDSPYFEPRSCVFDEHNGQSNEFDLNREGSPSFFSVREATSPSAAYSYSSKTDQDGFDKSSESYPQETQSPTSAMAAPTFEDIKAGGTEQFKALNNLDQITVPGIRPSMSISDLVNHLEHRVSEQATSSNPMLSSEEWQSLQILDNISQYLNTDIQDMPDSDEKMLLSRVNSLCCLLQKDNNAGSNGQYRTGNNPDNAFMQNSTDESNHFSVYDQPSMSKKDSVADLLLNLPRIASLPRFLVNFSEDYENHGR